MRRGWTAFALIALGACSVERDLSPQLFACDAGGSCGNDSDGGSNDAGPGDGGSPGSDAGEGPIPARCLGDYTGSYLGDDVGGVDGTLSASGALMLDFTGAAMPFGEAGLGQVDMRGQITPVSGVSISGGLRYLDCKGSGTWSVSGKSGSFNIEH